MRSTCFSAAISSFAFSKTGFESHGSTSRTFPPGVTILKADCPYQVSCVSMEITKSKSVGLASETPFEGVTVYNGELSSAWFSTHRFFFRHSTSSVGHLPIIRVMNHEVAPRHISKSHPQMAELIRRSRRYEITPAVTLRPFDALAESIAYQQLSGKAAATIWSRVRALYPKTKWLDAAKVLATPDEKLRGAGLSRSKAAALKDLAAKTLDGTVPSGRALLRMRDEEIIARLTQVHGIGRWTVEMLLLFDLGRPDVWPVDDYGVRKGFAKTFGKRKLPTPKELMKHGEKWRPYRSVAAWYFWRALDDNVEKLNV